MSENWFYCCGFLEGKENVLLFFVVTVDDHFGKLRPQDKHWWRQPIHPVRGWRTGCWRSYTREIPVAQANISCQAASHSAGVCHSDRNDEIILCNQNWHTWILSKFALFLVREHLVIESQNDINVKVLSTSRRPRNIVLPGHSDELSFVLPASVGKVTKNLSTSDSFALCTWRVGDALQ